jgi:hypothetical protein
MLHFVVARLGGLSVTNTGQMLAGDAKMLLPYSSPSHASVGRVLEIYYLFSVCDNSETLSQDYTGSCTWIYLL